MAHPRLSRSLGAVLIFFCGTAIGQRANFDKVSKYLKPTVVTELDFRLLQANIAALRANASYHDGISVPNITYDDQSKRITVLVLTRNYLNKKSLESVRSSLPLEVKAIFDLFIKPAFPDVLLSDLIVSFTELETGTVAEYKDGKLDFHDRRP